jgi:hypothetical protein
MPHLRLVHVAVLFLLLAPGDLGPRGAAAEPALALRQTFGTATEIAHVVTAAEFDTVNSTLTWYYTSFTNPIGGYHARFTDNPTTWIAGLRLPAGAVVTRLEVSGCNESGLNELRFYLSGSKVPVKSGYDALTPVGIAAPGAGCGRFTEVPASPPLVIDNANTTYWIVVATFSQVYFDSVRVYYQLQVSPAPGTATFGDVPTSHPFFQFVEALVKSGVTAGCGGGNYCPDAALTRGQMAVFLSKALGLHFAP